MIDQIEVVEGWEDNADLTLTTSSAPRVGDLLVVVRGTDSYDTDSIPAPDSDHDWASEAVDSNGDEVPHLRIFTAEVTVAGAQSVDLPYAQDSIHYGFMMVLRGHAGVVASAAGGSGSAISSHVAPSVSGTTDGLLICTWVAGGDVQDDQPVTYSSLPAAMNGREVVQGSSGTRWSAFVAATQTLSSSGITGSRTSTFSRAAPYSSGSITIAAAPTVDVRQFDGNSWIELSPGSTTSVPTGALTLACIARLDDNPQWRTPLSLDNADPFPQAGMQVSPDNDLHYTTGTTFPNTGVVFSPADGWALIAITKTAGTTNPRAHKYVYDTETWTHQNASGTAGNGGSISGGTVRIGDMADFGERWRGRIAVLAVWNRQLSDVELEALTEDLSAWLASAPAGLWPLNQPTTATPVSDATGGGADQVAITGTAVVGDTELVDLFTFAQVSGTFAATIPPPHAQVAANLTVNAQMNASVPAPHAAVNAGSTNQVSFTGAVPAARATADFTVDTTAAFTAAVPAPRAQVTATVVNPMLAGIRVGAVTGPAGPQQRWRVSGPEV